MKVLIVDDHELFRSGLRLLLKELAKDVEFYDTSGVDKLDVLCDYDPDLVLLDYHLPCIDGPVAISRIQQSFPTAAVVVLSGDDRPTLIRKVLDSGASGFIPKHSSKELLVQALKLVLAGGIYLPPEALVEHDRATEQLSEFVGSATSNRETVLAGLSLRQRETTLMAVRGATNKTIADELNISEGTVKAHLSTAYKTLGVKNRTEALLLLAGLESLDNPGSAHEA